MAAPYIHPSSVIEEAVSIGDDCAVWHFCHLSRGAVIGARTTLGQNVFIGEGVRVGSGVKIQNNVSVYAGVEVSDDVFLGPSVVFTNVKRPRAFLNQRGSFKATVVGQGATVGANTTVICGVRIGEYAFIGAGSVVTKDVPAFAQVLGNPARQVGWVDKQGEPTTSPPR